jgi:hypothetical protein
MVITVVPIVDPDLNAGLLSFGFGHNYGGCNNGGGQD